MLSESLQKVKKLFTSEGTDLFLGLLIFLVGIIGFGLGRLSIFWPQKEPVTIEHGEKNELNPTETKTGPTTKTNIGGTPNTMPAQGAYVASKAGTAYHLPWCPGALKIKMENKVWFETKEEAEGRGYKPAGNCPGL